MQDEELCKELISRIVGKPIHKLTYHNIQQLLQVNADGHYVQLDLYVKDEAQTAYDVEMENSDQLVALARRCRHYMSMVDSNAAFKKEGRKINYATDIKDLYVIFICTTDPFKENRHCYTFTMRCKENPELELDSGATLMLLNCQGTKDDCSPELRRVLDYINGEPASSQNDSFVLKLNEKVQALSRDENVRRNAMFLSDKENVAYTNGYAGGMEKGREEQRNQMILKLNQRGVAAEVIAESADVTVDYVQKIVASQAQPVLPQ